MFALYIIVNSSSSFSRLGFATADSIIMPAKHLCILWYTYVIKTQTLRTKTALGDILNMDINLTGAFFERNVCVFNNIW